MFMSRAFAVVGFEARRVPGASADANSWAWFSRVPQLFPRAAECEAAAVESWTGGKTCISYAPQEPEIHSVTRPVSCADVCVFPRALSVFRVCSTTQKAFLGDRQDKL